MKKILHIISSPRGKASFSIRLSNAIIEKINDTYPGSTLTEYNLIERKFPHLEESHLTSFFTPAEQRSAESLEAIKHSDQAIEAILAADIIVIGAPLYNFGIHSALKAWIDHIARAGVTFSYGPDGPKGLITGKKAYVAISSGGIYSTGSSQCNDFVGPYLKAFLGFIGITDVTILRAEGTVLAETMDTALEKGIEAIVID